MELWTSTEIAVCLIMLFGTMLMIWRMVYCLHKPGKFARWFFALDKHGEELNELSPAFFVMLMLVGLMILTGVFYG